MEHDPKQNSCFFSRIVLNYSSKSVKITIYANKKNWRNLLMAKKSKITKAKKQQETIERYAALRQELKAQKDYEGLRKLPLDARPERLKNRDLIDGRPRGYMRKFGMSRIKFRELAHKGLIPGVKKASW